MDKHNHSFQNFNNYIVLHTRKLALPFSRFAIFVLYFWFGAIKVFAENGAANPLVTALLNKTLPGVDPATFLVMFGCFEMVVGVMFLIPRLARFSLFLLGLHLITTLMPLFLLPQYTWKSFMVPTLEGQYIIKNILIIALAIGILAHMHLSKGKNN